jgi:hypothetical protein
VAYDVPPEDRARIRDQARLIAANGLDLIEREDDRGYVASAIMLDVCLTALLDGRDPHEALKAHVRKASGRRRRRLAAKRFARRRG